MRWTLLQSANPFHCWKLEQDGFIAELKYNKESHSFRVEATDKRLFFIEKTGLLQNKFLIRNEYNVIAAEISSAKDLHSGAVILDNKKYNYFLKDNLLVLSSKKEKAPFSTEIKDRNALDRQQLCALLFCTLRIARSHKAEPAIA